MARFILRSTDTATSRSTLRSDYRLRGTTTAPATTGLGAVAMAGPGADINAAAIAPQSDRGVVVSALPRADIKVSAPAPQSDRGAITANPPQSDRGAVQAPAPEVR